ncbi:acyl carrier protein [Amycolatopsis australiensis]|uniref:Act minimal PKS acyl carrier protein n=1 Tax=Amycolatopsis australiensis TaxID=546364 RepID=A0A1K1S2V0_9PSEU|nr:acyl carrier protein [Amycolatopsis australiensis]SFW78420.1 act minimal PKS acyl carrier protein [Amycolatopsis australiensis]
MADHTLTLADLRRILGEAAGADEATAGVDADAVDTSFEDLGYDSLALMETASRIEREYAIKLDESVLADADTPRALLDLVNEQLSAGVA